MRLALLEGHTIFRNGLGELLSNSGCGLLPVP